MIGPDNRVTEYIECGPNLEPLQPTPHLRIVGIGEVLEQWFEASCTINGVTHFRGRWCPVRKR